MIKSGDGYELIIGSSLDAQFGPCCYSAPAANWSRFSGTAPWACRRSIPLWRAA